MQILVNKTLTPTPGVCEGAHGLGAEILTVTMPGQSSAGSSFFNPIYFKPQWNSCFGKAWESCPSQGLNSTWKEGGVVIKIIHCPNGQFDGVRNVKCGEKPTQTQSSPSSK